MAERILIVDDDPVQRRRLETIVANSGYEPVVVATGDAALAVLADPEQTEVDCVVLDLVMPDLDGLGVLARMRQTGLAIPVIVQAAQSGIDNVLSAIHAGAADFVVKPVGVERLQVALRNALVHRTLIGHEKGTVPGAAQRHSGKLVEAAGGTLFLREVGTLPPETQTKLFRAIETSAVEPVGARKQVPIDVRVISATSRDLIAETNAGRFREDLLYRLQTFQIAVPPLRDRPEEIPNLVRRFLLRFAAEEGRRVHTVFAEALDMLIAFAWPGNVRQLENAVFRAVALADGDELGLGDFPQFAKNMAIPNGAAEGGAAYDLAGQQPKTAASIVPESWTGAPATSLPLLAEDGQIRSLAEIEADVIRFAVNRYRRRISEVARKLGIGRATLYRKLEALGTTFNNVNDPSSVSIG